MRRAAFFAALFAARALSLSIRAVDMSSLAVQDCAMRCNKFRAHASALPSDALSIVAAAGFNTLRLRVWVNPTADHPEGNVTYVVALAKRAAAAGLHVWIDFHLSGWWADPGHQLKPQAWATLGAADLEAAVRSHVTTVLRAVSTVSTVALVQVGNEISPGALWPEAGQACADSGSVLGACKDNWVEFARLIAAGIGAARTATPAALIAIHTDLGNRGKDAAADAIWWHTAFDAALPPGVDYDVIALSYYMQWSALGPPGEASIASALSARFPTRRVLMAETRASWTGSPTGPYPATPAGQLAFWHDTIGNATGWLGVAWWGAEYVGDPKLAQFALFDGDYVALPALTDGWAAR